MPHAPPIVFVTAHASHALSAFELAAVDYLTKPVRRERLQEALLRMERLQSSRSAASSALAAPPADACVLVQERGRTERVPLADVRYIKAEQKYLTVRTALRTYILDGSLNDWEARHGALMLRIHRSTLVARAAMRALEKTHDPQEGDGWALRLQGVAELLPVSRRQLAAVREALSQ